MRRSAVALMALAMVLISLVPIAQASGGAFPGADGKIVYESHDYNTGGRGGRSRLFTIDADGSHRHAITPRFWDSMAPTWSADGAKVAFVRQVPPSPGAPVGEEALLTADADGTNVAVVLPYRRTGARRIGASPAWSPDGSLIAFCAFHHFSDPRIFVVDSDGSNLRKLTVGAHNDCDPSWSPDGSSIVVDSYPPSVKFGVAPIVTLDPTDGTRTVIVGDGFNLYPDFSPDGTHLVFARGHGRSSDLFTVRTDGSELTNITKTPKREEIMPAYAPSGAEIVFAAYSARSSGDLWILASDGTGPIRRVTDTPHRDDYYPHWQPI